MLPGRTDFHSYVKDRGTEGPELDDPDNDIGEKQNLPDNHPHLVRDLMARAAACPMPTEPINPDIQIH